MRKIFLILTIVFIVVIVIPTVSLFVYSKLYHKSLNNDIVQYINNKFEEQVSFKDFSFSYLRRFPRIQIELEEVSVSNKNKEVISIGKLDVIVNLRSLWNKKLNVERLIIKDAALFSEIDSFGNKPHLLTIKDKTSKNKSNTLIFESRKIQIQNSKVYLGNIFKGNRTYLQVSSANFKLTTRDSLLVFTGEVEGQLDSLITNNAALLTNQPIKIVDVVLKVNQLTGEKEIEQGDIFANTLRLKPRIKMRPKDDGQWIELHITAEDNINTFLDLFEFPSGFDIKQVNPEAKLILSYNQTGFVNPVQRPYSELDFEITNAEFTGAFLPIPIKVSAIRGNYNNGEGHSPETVQLVIDTIHAEAGESFLNGRLKLDNLKDPIIDARLSSFINFSNLIKETDKLSLTGSFNLDLALKGKISELRKMHYSGYLGSMNVYNASLVLKDDNCTIDLFKGSAVLDNHVMNIAEFAGTFNQKAFHLSGVLHNPLLHLVSDKESLFGKFELNFDELDLTKINHKQNPESKAERSSLDLLSNVAIELLVNGKKIITEMGLVENLVLDCKQNNDKLDIGLLRFNYQGGTVNGSGGITLGERGITEINASLKGHFKNLDLKLTNPTKETDNIKKQPFSFPEYLKADLDLQIEKGNIEQVPVENLFLKTDIRNNEVSITKLSVDAFDGHALVSGKINIDSTGINGILLNAGLSFNHLNIEDLTSKFKQDNPKEPGKQVLEYPEKLDLTIDLKAADVVYKDLSITNLRSNIKATDRQIQLNGFYTDLPFGNLTMDITVNDYKTDKIKYFGSANLSIDSLQVDRFLELQAFGIPGSGNSRSTKENSQNEKTLPGLPQNIDLNLNVDAGYLSYKNATVSNLNLEIDYRDKRIDLDHLKFGFAGGTTEVHGYILKDQPDSYPGYLYSKVDSIEISGFFQSFDNFNQNVFTSQNSSGKISWASHYYFEMNKDLSLDEDGNLIILNTRISDAEFDQVEPIVKTLFFVGHKSKDKMIVKDLNVNAFLFKNKIYFTDVLMNDNIANLDVYGEVDLGEKELDIGIEISLSDLFFRTKKSRMVQTQAGVIDMENDKKIFLQMAGPMADRKLNMINKRKFDNNRSDIMTDIKKAQMEFGKKGSIK